MAETLIDFLDRVLQRTDRTGLRLVRGVELRTRNTHAELVESFDELAPAHEEVAPSVADELEQKIAALVDEQPAKTRLELRASFDTAPTERYPLGAERTDD